MKLHPLISLLISAVFFFPLVVDAMPRDTTNKVNEVADAKTVTQYCGVCHKTPTPNLMPSKDWPRAVRAMMDLANTRLKHEFISAEVALSIATYYYLNAPQQLPLLPYYEQNKDNPRFVAKDIVNKSFTPLVLNIHKVELGMKPGVEFIVGDAEQNKVLLLNYYQEKWHEKAIANVGIPLHSEILDYDDDGDNDIIIADLGEFLPNEKLVGKVVLLIQDDNGQFQKAVLLKDVGRITDVRPVDIDNDGDLDIAVAIFGGASVGGLVWIEKIGKDNYSLHTLLNGSGALNISPVDLNNDGKIDFISLIAQEHEIAVALINKGKGEFEHIKIAEASHPMFGFTSMKLVDLDGDQDIDVLMTNGDALDLQPDPKPYHGVQWLENKGNFQFDYHDIGRFYGAAEAEAGDLDNDGDMDIVASSWNNYWQDNKRQGLIWYENTGGEKFVRHNIAAQPQQIVSLELKDITGDGFLDIIGGVFRVDMLLDKILFNQSEDALNNERFQGDLESRVIFFENNPGTTNEQLSNNN